MTITALPTPPSLSRLSTFNTDTDVFLAALPQLVTELNADAQLTSLGAGTLTGTLLCLNTGLQIKSTAAAFALTLKPNEALTAARTLNLICGDASGTVRTLEKIPCVSAYLSANTANNVTGNGTFYNVVCDTEEVDTLSNFSAGVFTASVAGKYFCHWQVIPVNLGASHTQAVARLTTSDGRIFASAPINPVPILLSAEFALTVTAIITLSAGQSVTPSVMVNNSGQTVGISATAQTGGDRGTRFMAQLIAL